MSRIHEALKRVAWTRGFDTDASKEAESSPFGFDHYSSEGAERSDPQERAVRREPRPVPIRPAAAQVAEKAQASRLESQPTAGLAEATEDRLIDVGELMDYAGFVFRAVGRHRLLAVSTLVSVLLVSGAALYYFPRSYRVQAQLLAQRNDVMASLVNPGRAIPRDAESPTRAAAETVLRRDNLLNLARETNLLLEWERTRAPVLKLKDRVTAVIVGPLTEEEKLDGLIGLLEKRLTVVSATEGTVTFDVVWPDADVAFNLVNGAVQSFLQARQSAEIAAITDSISILERSAIPLQAEVDRTLAELDAKRAERSRRSVAGRRAAASTPSSTSAPQTVPVGPSQQTLTELTRLREDIERTQREMAAEEESRRQQLSQAEARLNAALTIYTDSHPSIPGLRQNVAALSAPSPELRGLRAQAQALHDQYNALLQRQSAQTAPRGGPSTAGSPATSAANPDEHNAQQPGASDAVVLAETLALSDSLDPTELRLRVAMTELAALRERTNSARAELATAKAGFKYRFSLIRPPQMPRGPISPKVMPILAAACVAALLLAIAAAIARDLLSDRVVEVWQVSRWIGIPTLGTADQP